MNTIRTIIASCLCLVLLTATVYAQQSADPRVAKALNSLRIKYEKTSDSDFKVLIDTENGRDQIVTLNSNTDEYVDLEIREVWSVAFISDGPLTPTIMRKLLLENDNMKFGSWKIVEASKGDAVVFYATIAANTKEENVDRALSFVARAADKMEKTLTNKDDR